MADEIFILVALDDSEEKERIQSLLSSQSENFKLLYPDSIASLDELLNSYNIDLIILDFQYQNGALADWLSLWPLPFIIFANPDEQKRLNELIKDEASFFLMRDASYSHVEILPLAIKKLFYYRELQKIQNKQVQLSERRYMELVQAVPDIVYHIDENGNFLFINDSVKYLGYEPIELLGKHFSSIIDGDEIDTISRKIVLKEYEGKSTGSKDAPKLFDERRTGKRKTENLIVKLVRKYIDEESNELLGSVISYGSVSSTGFIFNNSDSSTIGTVGIIRDVTQEIVKERLLEESNEEKSVLLREVHHRVKNNLQIILSLINLHLDDYNQQTASEMLFDIQSEIYSMALVHEQLYHSETISRIAVQEYLEQLIDRLTDSFGICLYYLKTEIHAQDIYLSLETSIPLGLIVNEISSYLFRTSLSDLSSQSTFSIGITSGKESYDLTIQHRLQNNGGHLYSKDELAEGLQLANLLIGQLNGEMHFDCSNGVKIAIKILKKSLQKR